jgi:hypothetical protein
VRGMTWIDGSIVYGSTAGALRSVPFDPTATVAVDGSDGSAIGNGTGWTSKTLFYSAS